MELSVDFECPACRKTLRYRLLDLKPGDRRQCPGCRTPAILTARSLRTLRQDLQIYCRS